MLPLCHPKVGMDILFANNLPSLASGHDRWGIMDVFDWVVVRTKPRQDSWAIENVSRQGRVSYRPMYQETPSAPAKPLWPGYLFVHCPDGQFSFLTGTWGVSHVLRVGQKAACVGSEFIARLRASENGQGVLVLPEKPSPEPTQFTHGQRVVVTEDPFLDLIGLYQGQSSSDRVFVLLQIMGRQVAVSLNRAAVKAA